MDDERLDIEKAVAYLTRDEKLRMLSGDGMWNTFGTGGLPRVRMSDGPNGLRMAVGSSAVPSTCYPTLGMLANSWDATVCYGVGAAIGREATAMGVNLLLAPGVNIKRSPLGGRNFEYFSEDPLLAGELGKAYISGVQSTGVGACVKHFAANSQESHRMYGDSVIDERALFELYLKPFRAAISAQPAAVMSAYNKLNGEYCSQNEYLLNTVLREQWGYNGVVLSDWGAVHDRVAALKAGLDLAMPCANDEYYNALKAAADRGEITDEDIDRSLRRILGLIDDVYLEPYGDFDADLHDRIAYNAAAASVVLLKNDNNFLPLTKNMNIAVCGELFDTAPIQGGGSSHVTEIKSVSAREAFGVRQINYTYVRCDMQGKADAAIKSAVAQTENSDAVIVYVGQQTPFEGADRDSLDLPDDQNALISALTAAGRKVVVVLCSAGPVLMPWINRVQAVVYSGLNGANGALAAADVLFGRINPCGKLAETFPAATPDFGDDFGGSVALYRESIFAGYRYYDATETPVLFPFGHGLSYSDITYDDMRIKRLGGARFDVTVTLTNRSVRDGYEIVQIYASDRTGRIMCAPKQLVGYAKVFVEGQTTTTVTIGLERSAFEFYNVKSGKFDVCDGEFGICAAASAGDIRKRATVKIDGNFFDHIPPGAYAKPLRSEITTDDFLALYGKPLPAHPDRPGRGEFTLDSCIDDIKKTFAGRIARHMVMKRAKYAGAAGSTERQAFIQSAMFTPLYAVSAMSDGDLPISTAKGLIAMANGKFFKGLGLILKKSE